MSEHQEKIIEIDENFKLTGANKTSYINYLSKLYNIEKGKVLGALINSWTKPYLENF